MTSLDAYDLIALWEQDSTLSAAEKAVFLLQLAFTDKSRDDIGAMPVGVRDRVLLDLRKAMFGDTLDGLATCSQCDEKLEVELQISNLLASGPVALSEPRGTLRGGGR